ncbi:TonB-dependent receptor [Phenylobacterium sp.]|uniref:TonB-dependent receptor n=1 Tax=Phenylobacterium sp. TaxID=1871053 RepID=UPI00374DE130
MGQSNIVPRSRWALLLGGAAAGLMASGARAADIAGVAPAVAEVIVTGEQVRSLEQFTPTGSRLDLSAKETPATLDIITDETMRTRGYLTAEEAANSLPGVTSGGAPGDLENFHIRGFSDTQITVLHNGIYVGPSDMVNRPQNSFNLANVEVLKGPASVLYGQGAIGGAVNMVNKAPTFGPARGEIYAAGGSFGTTAFGVGGSVALRDDLALRVDLSRTGTDGFVHGAHGDSLDATATLLWHVTAQLDVQFSMDFLQDHPSGYWGTPLVTKAFATDPLSGAVSSSQGLTLDKRLRFVNYNVADSKIEGTQYWPQLLTTWRPNETITVQNYLYDYRAKRRWIDSEAYSFNPVTKLIDRDRFFVFHDQKLWGDQASLTIAHPIGGLQNKLVVGFDYSHLDFSRERGFPDGDSVDPFHPSPGLFGPIAPRRSPTKWDDTAVFFEDILSLTPQLKLVTGGRYDNLDLDRKNFNANGSFNAGSSFARSYHPATYRVGVVYDVNEYVTPYVSYTTGQDPVGSNIFLVNAGENFSLGKSRQFEAGVKASAPQNRASATLAVFDIRRDNVLTSISPDVAVPIGSESSKGFEATADVKLTQAFTLSGNLAYTEAKYREFAFVDGSGALVNASGNQIPNAPKWVANLWGSYLQVAGLPVDVGGGVRYVGDRTGDNANTLTLKAYATLNAYVTYHLNDRVAASIRADNLNDKAYVQAADIFYPSEVILGRPRYVQFDISAKF